MGRKRAARRKAARAQRDRAERPSEELKIAVTFRRPSDQQRLTQFEGRMTPAVAKSFQPESAEVERALAALQQRGFTVTSRGQTSVSVRGRRRDFEKLFGTKLDTFKLDERPEAGPTSARAFFYPPEGAPWKPDEAIASMIDDAYIQWPHIYMNQRFSYPPSAIPPQVDYHHLRVPGDVALILNAGRVHREGTTGRGVRVVMIDSGFNHNLPYFQERGYNSSAVLAPGASDVEADGNGHGTGESANIFAVAPDVIFTGVKLDNEQNPGLSASVLEGFQVALQHNPQIISVSLGYDLAHRNRDHYTSLPNSLRALEAEIEAAVADGIVVLFAAGNGHVAFPGMMPDVVSAGGVYVAADGAMEASDYASAFRSQIYLGRNVPDFCGLVGLAENGASYIMLPLQPGCRIDGRDDGTAGDDGWGVFSGTSAAAPQLAGVCALLLERNPGLTPDDLKAVLRRTSRDVVNGTNNPSSSENEPIPAGQGNDGATGTGLVDAFAAWRQV